MRESIPYKIIGGVRFYERKEIKDALAYLKLIINPHDDVSLRRVINVPARGVGKGVMDSLQAIDPDADRGRCAAAAGGGTAEVSSARSLWARWSTPSTRASCGNRAVIGAARVPRPDRRPGAGRARTDTVSIAHRQDARPLRLPQRPARREQRRSQRADREPDGARVGGARLRGARRRRRRSAASSIGCRCCRRPTRSPARANARVWLMSMHAAKGLEFPRRLHRRAWKRACFPHSRSAEDEDELEEERRLCYVGMTRAQSAAVPHRAPRGGACSASTSRPSRRGSSTRSRRSWSSGSRRPALARTRAELRARPLRVPDQPVRPTARAAARVQGRERRTTYENEDQSATGAPQRHARQARAVRRRHRPRGRRAHRRLQDHRALQHGRREEAAGEVREARTGVATDQAALKPRPTIQAVGSDGSEGSDGPPFSGVGPPFSSLSFSASCATETTLSPSSISISRTPCVARPIVRMSPRLHAQDHALLR